MFCKFKLLYKNEMVELDVDEVQALLNELQEGIEVLTETVRVINKQREVTKTEKIKELQEDNNDLMNVIADLKGIIKSHNNNYHCKLKT